LNKIPNNFIYFAMLLPHCALGLSIAFVVAVAHPIISTRAIVVVASVVGVTVFVVARQCQMRQLAKIFYGKVEQSMKQHKGTV